MISFALPPQISGFVKHYIRVPTMSSDHPIAKASVTLAGILRTALPLLVFLLIYSFNGRLQILPGIQDLQHVHVYTMAKVQALLLHFDPQSLITAVHSPALDWLAALPYMAHYAIPVAFPLYLARQGKYDSIHHFFRLMGYCMWMMYFIWLLFPLAPPWVLQNINHVAHNVTAQLHDAWDHKEGCAFHRLDNITGWGFFHEMFESNPVLFGSFPSGHVAFPTIVYLTGSAPGGHYFIAYILYMIWATIYSCHHYLLDGVAAVLLVFVINQLLLCVSNSDLKSLRSTYTCSVNSTSCSVQI